MVNNTFVGFFFYFMFEASTILMLERELRVTTWTPKLAIANNQVIGSFGGNSSLKSASMARSFPKICGED